MTRLDIFIRNALLLKLHVQEDDLTLPQETILMAMIHEVYGNKHFVNETIETRIDHVISLYDASFPR